MAKKKEDYTMEDWDKLDAEMEQKNREIFGVIPLPENYPPSKKGDKYFGGIPPWPPPAESGVIDDTYYFWVSGLLDGFSMTHYAINFKERKIIFTAYNANEKDLLSVVKQFIEDGEDYTVFPLKYSDDVRQVARDGRLAKEYPEIGMFWTRKMYVLGDWWTFDQKERLERML